jgi:fatty acid desaturase
MSTATRPTEDLRRRIKADLPADTFEPRPLRALWFVPLATVGFGSIATIVVVRPAWYLCLALSLVAAQCMAASGFLAHEVLHGSVVSQKWLQTFLGYVGFAPLLVSPTLWRTWHNQVHHRRTNLGNSDPDAFGTVERFQLSPSTQFVARLAPGSRHPLSYLFFAYWFTFHGQVVLWLQSRYLRGFRRMNRRRAIAESAVSALVWLVVAVLAGPFYAIFAVLIPLVVTNFVVMSYIATNHFMRPLTKENDPLENSMSVNTLAVVDRLHFNFSHHVEHHLFPNMSGAHAPRVRAWLLEHEADRYVSPAHWKAFLYLYRTPRVYLDATTLVDPDDPDGPYRADTRELAELLH